MVVLPPTHARYVPSALTWRVAIFLIVVILGLQALGLFALGHVTVCKCGYIKFWHGIPGSSENSQHLADWYTFSHVIHGFLLYFLLRLILPRAPISFLLVLAVTIEAGWEILENTSFIIDRYRSETISFNYFGDSIVNSLADTAAMIVGFVVAGQAPVWLTVVLIIVFEAIPLYAIRDNLTLNIIMLLHPFDAIHQWQAGSLTH